MDKKPKPKYGEAFLVIMYKKLPLMPILHTILLLRHQKICSFA